jgi:hypothetical protein
MNVDIRDVEALRRLLMEQPEAGATRILALSVSAAFFLAVLNLVRRGRLREEYTPIWIVVAVGIMTLSVWFDIVRAITRAVGAWTASSTLFFFGEIFLLVLCLNYAVRLSSLAAHVKLLAQEVAILRAELAASALAGSSSGAGARPGGGAGEGEGSGPAPR